MCRNIRCNVFLRGLRSRIKQGLKSAGTCRTDSTLIILVFVVSDERLTRNDHVSEIVDFYSEQLNSLRVANRGPTDRFPVEFCMILTFHCSQEVITSQSSYLKRLLSDSSDVAVALPSGLTFDAFVHAVASCYGSDEAAAELFPASLAAVWVATGWLELSAGRGLARAAEDYFFQEVATDHGRAAEVLRSCAAFLGGDAAGPAADLLARCLEVFAASGGYGGRWLDDVAALPVEEFLVAVEAMRARFAHDHDLMYTVVDYYLENHKGELTEEDKGRLCYNVNCTKLSQHLFMHLVQNPRLPLRFVVQAMLVEQLHSHHSMLLSHHHHHHHHHAAPAPGPPPAPVLKPSLSGAFSGGLAGNAASMTLGDILQRDAALRQSAHIRASMQGTSLRIETLERELASLRTRLRHSEQQQQAEAAASASSVERAPGKSASFRIPRSRLWDGEELAPVGPRRAAAARDGNARGFKSRLVHGFKNLFGRRQGAAGAPSACGEDASTRCFGDKRAAAAELELEMDDDEVLCVDERWRPHRRNHSLV
ncbi:hypothetical protein PVAP13_2KG514805 [Panicum virgatum]|uniref:NPH3 domain-containing protein n=1 Tax=Panicum virgatum TaxID=38727 RepID=A0A8T0WTH7_PANVG|nr:hypothetical protein PVAP13_2KG514805 [Panicum virgatum]